MKTIFKSIGTGIGYGLGIAGWVGVFAAGIVYGKCKKLKTHPEEMQELAEVHDRIDEVSDMIVQELGIQ